jgi:hypothetical protein
MAAAARAPASIATGGPIAIIGRGAMTNGIVAAAARRGRARGHESGIEGRGNTTTKITSRTRGGEESARRAVQESLVGGPTAEAIGTDGDIASEVGARMHERRAARGIHRGCTSEMIGIGASAGSEESGRGIVGVKDITIRSGIEAVIASAIDGAAALKSIPPPRKRMSATGLPSGIETWSGTDSGTARRPVPAPVRAESSASCTNRSGRPRETQATSGAPQLSS